MCPQELATGWASAWSAPGRGGEGKSRTASEPASTTWEPNPGAPGVSADQVSLPLGWVQLQDRWLLCISGEAQHGAEEQGSLLHSISCYCLLLLLSEALCCTTQCPPQVYPSKPCAIAADYPGGFVTAKHTPILG